MYLKEFLEKVIRPFGFSDAQNRQVVTDLAMAIGFAVISQIKEDSENRNDIQSLKMAIETKDLPQFIEIVQKMMVSKKYQQEIDKAAVVVLKDWLDNVLPTISGERQEEVRKIFALLSSMA